MKNKNYNNIINELIIMQKEADEWNNKYRKLFNDIKGKWIYFNDEDSPSHHGKIIKDEYYLFPLAVRCKNGYIRYVNLKDIVAIFDAKKECFDYKPEERDVA